MTRFALRGRNAALLLALAASPLVAAPALQDRSAQEGSAPRAAEEAPRPDPFLWQIEGLSKDGEPIQAYLFGTVHLPDERVLDLHPEVERAFESSGAFYSEIETTEAATAEVQRVAQLPGGLRLSSLVGEALWQRIQRRLEAKKVPPGFTQVVDLMEPWAASALLPQLDYLPAQMKGAISLDETLYRRARAAKKPTTGLETVAEQIGVFTAFDRTEQVELLREGLDQLERDEAEGKDPVEETVLAWLSGQEAKLLDILEQSFQVDAALRRRAEDGLLWERNLRFAERIDAALRADAGTTAFIAVGALHMPDPRTGEDGRPSEASTAGEGEETAAVLRRAGLVTLLRERGYAVTRVRAPEPAGAQR
ncbi:MAG: TraB/GumN family protein [Planctomycetota bacterium]